MSRPGRCATLGGTGKVGASAVLPAAGVLIESAPSSPVGVALQRFAARGFHRLDGAVAAGGAGILRVAPDADHQRSWHVQVSAVAGPITVCPLASTRSNSAGTRASR